MVVMLYFAVGRDRLLVAVSSMLVNGGFIVLLMVMFNQQLIERQKAEELAETLESANAKLAAYAAKNESLTLQNERQRMARELHDTLAQGVAGLVLQLEAVKAHLGANRTERASAIVEQSLVRARSTLADSRAAIDDLRAAPADLSEAVREKIERFTQATGIPCELEIALMENQIVADVKEHALHVLSESLANVARHAQATQTDVKFTIQNDQLELEVRDNGKGFDVELITNGHYGLLGMRERARLTGGTLLVESKTNSGATVRFVVPNSPGGEMR
jgi:NarL family two-component system sensor histidine kinase YdfH